MIFTKQIQLFNLSGQLLCLLFFLTIASIEKAAAAPLKSAAEPDYPPFSMADDKDQAIGFSIDLLNATAKAMKREINFKIAPWSEIKQELSENKLDVLPLVGRTPERESLFDFTVPYLTLHGTIVTHKKKDNIQGISDLIGKKVGVMKGDVAEEYVLRKKLSNNIITTLSYENALQQLSAGKLDAVVVQNLVALQLIKKLKLNNLETRGQLTDFRYDWCFAVTEGDKQLLADLNEGLSLVIADGTYDQLRQKWLGILEPDNTSTYIYITTITAVVVMFVTLLIARLWQSSLRRRVKNSTAELEYYKNDLEALVTTRTKELEIEKFRLNQAQEITHIGSYRWDIKEDITTWTDELYRITGYEPQAFTPTYDKYIACIHPDDKELFKSITQEILENKAPYSGQYRLVRPDGTIRNILEKGDIKLDTENNLLALVGVIQDVTEQKVTESEKERLQRELSQSQKMDALGQLTGGIAHDFNNMLGIIVGYTDLALSQCESKNEPKLTDYLKNIQQSSERARKLVSQMMVFSRSDHIESKPLQLAPLIEEDIKMLRATIPSSIEFDISYQDNLPDVVMEPVSLQQLLINICFNAKDEMNGTGKISISLGWKQEVNDECSVCHKQIHGEWIELTITDTGRGIKQDIINHIFEPFFTTKTVGKGSGMGMAMVGSIVKTFNGHIIVRTELGKGTSFHLLFPPAIEKKTRRVKESK